MITKEKKISLVSTAIFFILIMLFLVLYKIEILKFIPQELEGIPVMFGYTADAGGNDEPPMLESTPEASISEPQPSIPPVVETKPTPPVQQKPSQNDLIAQHNQESIKVKAEAEKKRRDEEKLLEQQRQREEAAEQRRKEEAAAKARQAEENRRKEINSQMSGLFGDNPGGSRGNTTGTGVQGVSTGNSTSGAASGVGGIGTYDLGGRSVGSGGLTRPKYTVNDEGTVVINITVDPQGNVIQAEIGKGTNTPNTSLRNEAIKAARSTKFNSVTTGNNQRGTITYKFSLN